MLGLSCSWIWILKRVEHRFNLPFWVGFHLPQQTLGGLGTYKLKTGLHHLFKKDPVYLESPFVGGRGAWGEGWLLGLLTYYSYITPWLVHWKKTAGIKKNNSSYFLSIPKLVCYVYLMALHEDTVRPWTCNDLCFHTEHMDFGAGVCLDRAHCQLRLKHPWASRKAKAYFNISLKKGKKNLKKKKGPAVFYPNHVVLQVNTSL